MREEVLMREGGRCYKSGGVGEPDFLFSIPKEFWSRCCSGPSTRGPFYRLSEGCSKWVPNWFTSCVHASTAARVFD
jgi:hypothetical protein